MNCKGCATKFTRLKDLTRHAISEQLRCQPVHFICIPCSLPLQNIPYVIQHIESEEHSIMALATGIHFYTPAEVSDNAKGSFPPHNVCLLCSCRDLSWNNTHLKSPKHKYFVSLMKDIFRGQEIRCSDMPISFISKLIHVQQNEFPGGANVRKVFLCSSQFLCELCNIYFNKLEHYKQHLEDQSHKRIELFMINISNMMKGKKVMGAASYSAESKTFSNSLTPLFYCELCCLFIDSTVNYDQHSRSISHKRILELFSKLSNKRNGDAVNLCDDSSTTDSHFNLTQHYCKLCCVGFSDVAIYHTHLNGSKNGIGHLRIEKFINSLTSKNDKKFINDYIDAQAHLKFNNTPPPNYCELCDILFSKFEIYELHLQSEKHKQAKKYYLKVKNGNVDNFGEKCSKMLKLSSESLHFCSESRKHKRSEEIRNTTLKRKKNAYCGVHATYTNSFPRPGFDAYETNTDFLSRNGFGAETYSYSNFLPGFEAHETFSEYRLQLGFEARETDSYFPYQHGFRAHETYNNFRPSFDFEDEESTGNSSPEENEEDNEHYCELCDFTCYNPLHYDKHLTGEQHKKMRTKMLNKKGKEIRFDAQGSEMSSNSHPLQHKCELCDILNSNSRQYNVHLNSGKHKRNKWLLYVFKQKCL